MSAQVRDVIIIGSGPAGYTAAVYAARANLQPDIFDVSVTAGGALMNTTEVENFPGFPAGIMGPDLMEAMRAQAERFGAQMVRDNVTGVCLRDTLTGATRLLPVRGVFVAIGHDPRNELIKDVVDLDEQGYVKVAGRSTATNITGVFAAGDLVDHTYRQAVTAAGSGCAAALDAEHHLRDLETQETPAVTEPADDTVGVGS